MSKRNSEPSALMTSSSARVGSSQKRWSGSEELTRSRRKIGGSGGIGGGGGGGSVGNRTNNSNHNKNNDSSKNNNSNKNSNCPYPNAGLGLNSVVQTVAEKVASGLNKLTNGATPANSSAAFTVGASLGSPDDASPVSEAVVADNGNTSSGKRSTSFVNRPRDLAPSHRADGITGIAWGAGAGAGLDFAKDSTTADIAAAAVVNIPMLAGAFVRGGREKAAAASEEDDIVSFAVVVAPTGEGGDDSHSGGDGNTTKEGLEKQEQGVVNNNTKRSVGHGVGGSSACLRGGVVDGLERDDSPVGVGVGIGVLKEKGIRLEEEEKGERAESGEGKPPPPPKEKEKGRQEEEVLTKNFFCPALHQKLLEVAFKIFDLDGSGTVTKEVRAVRTVGAVR